MKQSQTALFHFLFYCLVTLTASPALAEAPHYIRLHWIAGDSEPVLLDWRIASSWIWIQNALSLQVWIEAPRQLIENLHSGENNGAQFEITGNRPYAPFVLHEGHQFVVLRMTSPSTTLAIPTEDSNIATHGLTIDVQFEKTTWLRGAGCDKLNPFIEERELNGPGPFFISLLCIPESSSKDGNRVIRVGISDDADLTLIPANGVRLKSPHEYLIPRQNTEATAFHSIGTLQTHSLNGDSHSQFSVAFDPAPQQITASTIVVPKTIDASTQKVSDRYRIGLGAQSVQSIRNHTTNENGETSIKSTVQFARGASEFSLPIDQLGFNSSTTFAKLRLLYQPTLQHAWNLSYGVEAYRLVVHLENDAGVGTQMGLSPAVVLNYQTERIKGARLRFGLSPIDIRSQLAIAHARFEKTFNASESNWNLFAELLQARTMWAGDAGWSFQEINIGFTKGF